MRLLFLSFLFLASITAPAQNYYADIHDGSVQQGSYRITFSSFPPQADHPAGHAFVTWQQETPNGLITLGVFGFWPTVSNGFMVVWEDGALHPELQSTIDLADRSVSFRVDQAQLAKSLAIKNSWLSAPPIYTIDGNNCVDFVVNVGKSIGIVMPGHGPITHLLPDSYMKNLIDQLEDGKLKMQDGDTIGVSPNGDYAVGNYRQPVDGSDPVFSGRQRTTAPTGILEATYSHGEISGPACTWYPDGRTWYRDDSVDPEVSMMLYPNQNLLIGYNPDKKIQEGRLTNVQGNLYEGPSQDGHPNGQGKMTVYNGVVYEGTFINGDEAGAGKMSFPNGQVATGQFLGGRLMSGRVTFPNGTYIEGQRDANGNFGQGAVLHNSDGSIFHPDTGGGEHGSNGNGSGGVDIATGGNTGHVVDVQRDYVAGKETITIDHGDHTEKIEHSFPPSDTNFADHN